MRDIILEVLKEIEECASSSHFPNEETLRVIKDVENRKNLVGAKEGSDFLKKLIS